MGQRKRIGSIVLLAALLFVSSLQAAGPEPNFLEPRALHEMLSRGEDVVLIDTMSRLECLDHSIPGSLCIADEEFAAEAPKILQDRKRHLVFYCESNQCYRSRETALMAIRMGYERVSILKGGIPAWKNAGYDTVSRERIPRIPVASIKPERLARLLLAKRDLLILDIRRQDRFREGHLPTAVNIPLYRLHERYAEIPLNRPVLVVDDRGLRSFLACSYLVRKGVTDVTRLFGGMEGWQAYESAKGGK
jgi:rhodanese-related sulfurtransferase